jgi:hypothetical protein
MTAFAQFARESVEHVHERPGAMQRRRFRANHQDAHGIFGDV